MADLLHLDLNMARMIQSEMDKTLQEVTDQWQELSRQINHLTEVDWQGPAAQEFLVAFGEIYSKEKQQLIEFERLSNAFKRELDQWEDTDRIFIF